MSLRKFVFIFYLYFGPSYPAHVSNIRHGCFAAMVCIKFEQHIWEADGGYWPPCRHTGPISFDRLIRIRKDLRAVPTATATNLIFPISFVEIAVIPSLTFRFDWQVDKSVGGGGGGWKRATLSNSNCHIKSRLYYLFVFFFGFSIDLITPCSVIANWNETDQPTDKNEFVRKCDANMPERCEHTLQWTWCG